MPRSFSLFFCLPLLPACATAYSGVDVGRIVEFSLMSAQDHQRRGNIAATRQIVEAVRTVDPEHPGVSALDATLPPEAGEFLFRDTLLGANLWRRDPVEREPWVRALLYIPDRVLDYLDIYSFDVHLGIGLLANLHFTRAVQAGAGARAVAGLGWHDPRSLGVSARAETEFTLPGIGAQAYAGTLVGTSGLIPCTDALAGVHDPYHFFYQNHRDYWAFGFSFTFLFFGIDYDIHPVEVADFLCGWALLDFLHDDFASTQSLGLSREERARVWELYEIRNSPDAVRAYRDLVSREGRRFDPLTRGSR